MTSVLRKVGIDVVATATTADDVVRKVRGHNPDVAVVDICLPPSVSDDDRVEAVRELRSIDPRMALLILSDRPDERCALAVLGERPEGFGFLVKARITDVADFTSSVRRVARGGTALDPTIVSRIAGRRPTHEPIDDLTNREGQVLALMAEGRSNRFIAGELVVTVPAVERHITNVFAKLGLVSDGADHRRVLAVLRYLDCGLHA
jgi:DNA-binding NarL/FixJ family response regulator